MACTIVTTPSLGASDWSNFITQVAGLKKGFMQLSYTNFYSTAESAIATGGVMEVNGSYYQFSETSIDYSTTTSANADLYIYAQPSAGGTECTIVALTAACIWVDSKQGFYASAASNNRAIGGMWVKTAGTYYQKFIYQGHYLEWCRENNDTRPLITKIYEIGEWNMNTTTSKTVAISQIRGRVIEYHAIIFSDTPSVIDPKIIDYDTSFGSAEAGYMKLNDGPDSVNIYRASPGIFATLNYDGTASTIPNRGYVYMISRA